MSEESQRKLLACSKRQKNVAAAFQLVAGPRRKKRHSTIMNQMVSSPFCYVCEEGHTSFPAQGPDGRSCSKIFLLSSSEV